MDLRFATLLACFFLSGFAALLYQTAWTRELSFVFGTSDLAVAAVLAAYMGGLALGSAVAARLAHRVRRPVLVYGVLEGAIALCALSVPWAIVGLDALYVGWLGGREVLVSGVPPAAGAFQLVGAFAILLLPTAFMGATLPLLARHAVRSEEEISSRIGMLYAINTAGAIAGTVSAAFLLMPELGLRRTVYVGAGLNFVVFGLAALSARGLAPAADTDAGGKVAGASRSAFNWILPAILVSGVVSFGYEVLWTRLLGHLLGASLQAFATMLASFLLGIALGSAAAARIGKNRERARLGFGLAQLGIAATSYAAFALADSLQSFSASVGAGPAAPLASAAVAATVLLPTTLCIGATFPFAVRILAERPERASEATARVYAWNTVGAILGALGTGFVLLPGLGFEGTLSVGVATSLALAAATGLAHGGFRQPLVAVAALSAVALWIFPAQTPWRLVASTAFSSERVDRDVIYSAVGRSATVVVSEAGGHYFLTTNGLPEASADALGMPARVSLAHWLGALPAFLRPEAKEIVVIGLGGGVALELLPQSYDAVHVIELEPKVLEANRVLAPLRDRDPLADPRVQVHLGDARGTLQLTQRRFDAIVSQPSHPWTAGASHLYTREFFELVRSRLTPDGVFVQWIGIHFVDEALLKTLFAALTEVFPHVQVFAPQPHGVLFAASAEPLDPLGSVEQVLQRAPEDLARLGIAQLEEFASRWVLGAEGSRALADGTPPNTDDRNFLAARSGSLGAGRLDRNLLQGLLSRHDPLLGNQDLNGSALVRSLVISGQELRASRLARSRDGIEREAMLGWVELSRGRSGVAARHFAKVLDEDPESHDAVAGLVMGSRSRLAAGRSTPRLGQEQLDENYQALIASWRARREREWSALEALDEGLAGIPRSDALYWEAIRLRIEWRAEIGDREQAAQAEIMARELIKRHWLPRDALLHARAAFRADDTPSAWASLREVANHSRKRNIASTRQGRDLAQRVLEIGRGLPSEYFEELELLLTGREPLARIDDLEAETETVAPETHVSP